MPDTQAIARAQIVAAMAAARGQVMTADESIRRHNENTRAMFLASNPDTPLEEARDVLDAAITAANEYNTTQRLFHHRPGDGAIATNAVMHDLFGQLLGMKTWVQDPQQLNVEIGWKQNKLVPWGLCKLPPEFGRKAVMEIGAGSDPVYGSVLRLSVSAVKKVQAAVEELFDRVARYLDENSIYRGKAVFATEVPQFIDLNKPAKELVFTARTWDRLNLKLFSLIEKEGIHIELGNDGKMIIWLEGDYGVGKSELIDQLTRLAIAHGFGVVQCRPEDNFDYALQMAHMNNPRNFVFLEDAESIAGVTNPFDVSKVLDQLDGSKAKTLRQTVFVFTTNHIEKITKGSTRYGRTEAIIHLGNLDREACERLAYIELGDTLADDVDFDRVYAAMGGIVLDDGGLPALSDEGGLIFKAEADITPAFMRQAFNYAKTASAIRHGLGRKVTTEDILAGVDDQTEQLAIHRKAPEARPREALSASLSNALSPMVQSVVRGMLESYTPTIYEQAREAADSVVESRIHGAAINREADGETWARVSTQ